MRVKILRVGHAAAASGLLVVTGQATLGCAAETEDGERVEEAGDALSPGEATLVIHEAGGSDIYMTQSTTDEFLRVGEQLHVTLPAWYLWALLYPSDPMPNDVPRLQALEATLELHALDQATLIGVKELASPPWNTTTDAYSLQAMAGPVGIPAKTDTLRFKLTVTDALNPGALVVLDTPQLPQVHVFGGELPSKSLLFDNLNGAKRQRVVEGDQLFSGAPFQFGVTDWRADQIVDRLTINTQIGVAEAAGRFGWYSFPIYGTLHYEVRYGVYFNDAQGWRPEALLAPAPDSVLLPVGSTGRTVYEAIFNPPAKATKMSLYLHVQAFLHVDYGPYPNLVEQWYAQGADVLVRDSYDNPNGAFTNYDYSLQK